MRDLLLVYLAVDMEDEPVKIRLIALLATVPLALAACSSTSAAPEGANNDDAADVVSELNYAGVPNVDGCIGVSNTNAIQMFLPASQASWAPEITMTGDNTSNKMAIYAQPQSDVSCQGLGGVSVNQSGVPDSNLTAVVNSFPNGNQLAVTTAYAYSGGGSRCPNGETVGFTVELNPYGTTPGALEILLALDPFACEFENWYTADSGAGSEADDAFGVIDCADIAQGNVSTLSSPDIGKGEPICLYYFGPTSPPQSETPGPEAPGAGLQVE